MLRRPLSRVRTRASCPTPAAVPWRTNQEVEPIAVGVNRAIPFGGPSQGALMRAGGGQGAYPHYYRGRCLGIVARTTSLLRMARVALTLAREGWRNHGMPYAGYRYCCTYKYNVFNSPRPPARLPVERSSDYLHHFALLHHLLFFFFFFARVTTKHGYSYTVHTNPPKTYLHTYTSCAQSVRTTNRW